MEAPRFARRLRQEGPTPGGAGSLGVQALERAIRHCLRSLPGSLPLLEFRPRPRFDVAVR
eukprot:2813223-Alexandrium_andersonii.AAC.1